MLPGAKIVWDIHYSNGGEDITDVVELGIYFYPKGQEPKYRQTLHLMGATNSARRRHSAERRQGDRRASSSCARTARIESFQPHMHLRGKAMSMEAILPNGQTQILSYVNNFNFNWHNIYVYADDAAPLLPKGTILKVTRGTTTRRPTRPIPIRTCGSATAIARWTRWRTRGSTSPTWATQDYQGRARGAQGAARAADDAAATAAVGSSQTRQRFRLQAPIRSSQGGAFLCVIRRVIPMKSSSACSRGPGGCDRGGWLGSGGLRPAARLRRPQLPLAAARRDRRSGLPGVEGWGPHKDGRNVILVGYFNRNKDRDARHSDRSEQSDRAWRSGLRAADALRAWPSATASSRIAVPEGLRHQEARRGRIVGERSDVGRQVWLNPPYWVDFFKNPANGNEPPVIRFAEPTVRDDRAAARRRADAVRRRWPAGDA